VFVLATFPDCFIEGDISFELYGKSLFKPVFIGVLCSSAILKKTQKNQANKQKQMIYVNLDAILPVFVIYSFQQYQIKKKDMHTTLMTFSCSNKHRNTQITICTYHRNYACLFN
jgi:hypothetical protein